MLGFSVLSLVLLLIIIIVGLVVLLQDESSSSTSKIIETNRKRPLIDASFDLNAQSQAIGLEIHDGINKDRHDSVALSWLDSWFNLATRQAQLASESSDSAPLTQD